MGNHKCKKCGLEFGEGPILESTHKEHFKLLNHEVEI